MTHVRRREREKFSEEELRALHNWLEAAYGDPPGSWLSTHWDDLGPGPHFLIEGPDGETLSHACVVWVPVTVGRVPLNAGYLEDVATRADVRGQGLGTAITKAAQELIEAEADIGLLSTGSQPFYERLGWVTWRGPPAVVEEDGSLTPTPEEDGNIMALILPRTPNGVTIDAPIVRPRRDAREAW